MRYNSLFTHFIRRLFNHPRAGAGREQCPHASGLAGRVRGGRSGLPHLHQKRHRESADLLPGRRRGLARQRRRAHGGSVESDLRVHACGFRADQPNLRSPDVASLLEKSPSLEAEILVLRKGLERIENFEGKLYRGANLPPEALQSYSVGATVTLTGISSASRKKQVALDFAQGQVLEFRVRHGKPIRAYSQQPQEDEVVIDHGARFKVISVKKIKKTFESEDSSASEIRELPYIVLQEAQ